ncbi:MAG: TRAP transporter substrate-binding protein [Corticimicrobacter sp.]|uniref:C4-dicarboxylate ABC transporter n=1 Tax=Corticimicrobacter populi TaxID=2175229 RepID=A0A2V1K3Q4_9BURK|nr:TRAP transporter substrate-binding protein [Corticimicrobacter populi]PWF24858.1 C4-dicarboxylate ABC transporter [Corticimicrobacter populi]QDQ86864.1 TRAP transporter substrate-binding protein [Alcaligenaceae bacterium SJ-26]
MKITRRTFLTGAIAAAPVFPVFMRQAHAAVTLTLGHGAAPNNPRALASEHFAKLVQDKTSGAVRINIAGAEQLGSDAAMLTSLRTGVLDFSVNSQGATAAVVPELNTLGLPFLFRDPAHALATLNGPIGTTLAERLQARGLTVLDWWDNGVRHVTNSKRPIHAPTDLAGLKVRVPADAMLMDIFNALGASPEQIAFGELYLALQQGVVDGQENPLANIDSSKLYEVNPYISLTGHVWQSNPFLMARMTQGKVGQPELAAIQEAAREAGDMQRNLMREADEALALAFRERSGVQVNEVDRPAFQQATIAIAENWKKKPFGDLVTQLLDAAAQ